MKIWRKKALEILKEREKASKSGNEEEARV